MAIVDEVIERVLARAVERLGMLSVPEPAYAVGLVASPGNPTLDIEMIAVAIERDRTKWADELDPDECVFQSWNPHEFSIKERPHVAELETLDESFTAAQAAAEEELFERGVDNPQRYVYNRAAAGLMPARVPFAVTEDFVAFVFDGPDHVETAANIRFSASRDALALLERKNLLM